MGRSLKHLSIRIKLTLIMVAASSVGLIITATTFIVREGPIFRTSMSRDLQSLAWLVWRTARPGLLRSR